MCTFSILLLYKISSVMFLKLNRIGDLSDEIEWQKFLSLACTALEKVHVYFLYSHKHTV